MPNETREVYNKSASRWRRREPNSLSDFTARPRVFDLCGEVAGLEALDLGCGEGYCARELIGRGARHVSGVDISEKMIDLALAANQEDGLPIDYRVGTVVALDEADTSVDLALGVFVYNYLAVAEVARSFAEVFRVLKPGGAFVFSVPHPSFSFIRANLEPPFYFDLGDAGYFSARDTQYQGKIFCRDKSELNVQMVAKNFEDYFAALAEAGFSRLPVVRELGVTEDMLALDPEFFAPVADVPLHVAFRITK